MASASSPADEGPRRDGAALDAVAFATMTALDARRAFIAVKDSRGWAVQGRASTAEANGDEPTVLRAHDNVRLDPQLAVTMIDRAGRRSRLSCPSLPAPLHLVAGVLEWDALT